ncbi:MAG: hypothetical protein IPM70_07790 [Proteobacteria bacterium]|nr:hypothetical protein [Pseudomonadota bacterium]
MNSADKTGRGRSDVITVLIAQCGMVVASLAVQSLLAWFLLPAGRGDYAVIAVVGTLAPSLLTIGIDRSIQYQLMSGRIDLSSALGSLGLLLLVCAAVSTLLVALAVGVGYLPQLRGNPLAWHRYALCRLAAWRIRFPSVFMSRSGHTGTTCWPI